MDANPSPISDIFDGVLDGVVDLNGAVAINLHDNIYYLYSTSPVDLVEFGVTFPFHRFDGSRNI
jgi:hypothetical protein